MLVQILQQFLCRIHILAPKKQCHPYCQCVYTRRKPENKNRTSTSSQRKYTLLLHALFILKKQFAKHSFSLLIEA